MANNRQVANRVADAALHYGVAIFIALSVSRETAEALLLTAVAVCVIANIVSMVLLYREGRRGE